MYAQYHADAATLYSSTQIRWMGANL